MRTSLSKNGISIILLLPLLAVLLFSQSVQADTGLPVAGSLKSLGVNIHFTDPAPGELEQIAAAGFHWVRMDFAWASIEKTKGMYDWSAYERLLTNLEKHNMRAIYILDYGNDLYEQGPPKSPAAREAFAKFAAAAAVRFKGRGVLWEMWNEPNGGFWPPTANVEEYATLALQTGKALKSAAPNEQYIGPATSGMDFPFIERCFQLGLLNYWDAVSFHPYRNAEPESAIADYIRIKGLIAQYAPKHKTIPILSGEWGYSELYPGLSLDLQSKYISREFLTNISNGLIVSIWYDWHDDGSDPKEPEHHFGTVYQDYRPKKTYIAAKTLAHTLSGYRFNKRILLADNMDYCLLFRNAEGKIALAVWTTKPGEHWATIPADSGKFKIVQNDGSDLLVQSDKSGIRVLLSGAPMYLVPTELNPALMQVADWPAMPPAVYASSIYDVIRAINPALQVKHSSASDTAITVSFSDNAFGDHFTTMHGFLAKPFTTLNWERRSAAGARIRVTLRGRAGDYTQETLLYPTSPLHFEVDSVQVDRLIVAIDNPTGAELRGELSNLDAPKSKPVNVEFAKGVKRITVALPVSISATGSYGYRLELKEQWGPDMPPTTTLSTPDTWITPVSLFDSLPDGSVAVGQFKLEPDGDPTVSATLSMFAERGPQGSPDQRLQALRINYQFDSGWKFLRLATKGKNHEPLKGNALALQYRVYGDGSGNILNARYVDASGQTFQVSAGALNWVGWRLVNFPLSNSFAPHWGGANDGVVHYPISIDTVALVDSKDRRATKGSIWIADMTISTIKRGE